MKKHWKALLFLLVLCCTGIVVAFVACQHGQTELPPGHYRVYVDGKEMEWHIKTSEDRLMLPFLALAESLGIPIEWQSDTTAHLSFADRTWMFDLSDVSLKQLGSNSNVLMPPPGSTSGRRTEVAEQDAYISMDSAGWFICEYMNIRIDAIDKEQREVRIAHIAVDK